MNSKIIVVSLIATALFSSCKKEENKSTPKRKDMLIGTWHTTYAGEQVNSMAKVEEQFRFVDTYKSDGTGSSTFMGDTTTESFQWFLSSDEKYLTHIRMYDGQPDTFSLEFYSFEQHKIILKDTSFGAVMYSQFEKR
jgi:thiaminase